MCSVRAEAAAGEVRIVRDTWGIAHVYAEDEWALFYGSGYATAQDRMLQMTLCRYAVQGRLAEILGRDWIVRDKRMRVLGLQRHAESVVPHLSEDTRAALEAYAAGVNAYLRTVRLPAIFERYGGTPELWRPADCVAQWMRVSERFDANWTGEVSALRNFQALAAEVGAEEGYRQMNSRVLDESAAVVTEDEMARFPDVYERLKGIAAGKPVSEPPKASHNWVVSGEKSTTGKPILESDPQIAVSAPSIWHEIHLTGGRYNVRGIGIAGAPGLLIGWNDRCAWGATALGSDNADLFQEELHPEDPLSYKWLDGWRAMAVHREEIRVKGERSRFVEVRKTHHGPIVNAFLKNLREGETFALHYLVLQEMTSSIEGLLATMRARNWGDFVGGMRGYRSPGLHMIYADVDNNIGYWALAAVPRRKYSARVPHEGWSGEDEWLGLIPFDEMPHLYNPLSGFISTANNLPVGGWYPHSLGILTGGAGDTARSWRLRELLSGSGPYSPGGFLTIHQDAVSPTVRDFARFALMVVEEEGSPNRTVTAAVQALKDWNGSLLTDSSGYPVAVGISTVLTRSLRTTTLYDRYGGGGSGVAHVLKDIAKHVEETGRVPADPAIQAWLVTYLQKGYEEVRRSGAGTTVVHRMPYQNNLEGFGSLDTEYDLISPPLSAPITQTIWSQRGNSYTQIVNLAEIDSSRSLLPPGVSEDPESPNFSDQVDLWVAGGVHPAPLNREAVEAVKSSEMTLAVPTTETRQQSDFDGSGTVDFQDFVLFAAAFGKAEGEPGYQAIYDLDGDGRIALADFVVFAQAFSAG
jgi:penicillin amidase